MPNTCTRKKLHCHFELDYLLSRDDKELSSILTGGSPVEIRTFLICLKASGKKYFVASSECDNKHKDGSCAGHEIKPN